MQIETGAGKAANGVVLRDTLTKPWRPPVDSRFDQSEAIAIRACEAQALCAEDRFSLHATDTLSNQALLPETKRSFRDRELGFADFADTGPSGHYMGKGKVGHDRSGRAQLITVIEVVDTGLVEVDRLLHPAQAERVGEKPVVLLRVRRHRSDVMQSLDILDHGQCPFR